MNARPGPWFPDLRDPVVARPSASSLLTVEEGDEAWLLTSSGQLVAYRDAALTVEIVDAADLSLDVAEVEAGIAEFRGP